jgi:hypothetical protein
MHDPKNDKFYCKYHTVSYTEGERCPACYPGHMSDAIKKARDKKIFKLNTIIFVFMALEVYFIIAALGGSVISAIVAMILVIVSPYVQGHGYQKIERWTKNA